MSRFHKLGALTLAALIGVLLFGPPELRWLGVAAPLSAFVILSGLGVAFPRLEYFGPTFCAAPGSALEVALSFDDGPDPASTPQLLDLLKDHGVTATFFCIGERVAAEPALARRIVAEGHALENHSQHHGWWMNFLWGAALRRELGAAQDTIEAATGRRPRLFRSPMGLSNPHLHSALGELDLRLVGWSVGQRFDQWRGAPGTTVSRLLNKIRPGSVIMLHDGGLRHGHLPAMVTGLISGLKARGYTLVGVEELMADAATAPAP